MLLSEAERPWWLHPDISMASVLSGLKYYCQTKLLGCVPRTRSSDKTRATIACKYQDHGCPLRLTVKKNVLRRDVVSANVSSFVPGTCQVDVSTAVGAVLRRSPPPGIPGLNTTGPTGIPVINPTAGGTVRRSTSPGIPGPNTTGPTNPIPAPVAGIPVDPSACSECPHGAGGTCVLTCGNGLHHFCADHVENMARHQVTGAEKSLFMRFKEFRCYYDHSLLDMQKVIAHVSSNTWQLISTALSEQAVIETQQAMQAQIDAQRKEGAVPQNKNDVAKERIRHMAVPRCPECSDPILDFEACSALVCGTSRQTRQTGTAQMAHRISGCGARLCAWCLKSIPASESHYEHVNSCHRNPDPGSSYPPQPHPAVWKQSMAQLTRERVFTFIELQRGDPEFRADLYKFVRQEFPEFQLTEEWLAIRYRWLEIMIDSHAEDMNVEKLESCRLLVIEMGYPDSDLLLRAIIFCNCEINAILIALRAAQETTP